MEYHKYINEITELHQDFLCFLDEENQNEENFNELITNIEKHKYQENPEKFKLILHLISQISNNHHRTPTFLRKIEQILSHYEEFIKSSITKQELFEIFRKNPRILHFLFERNIISIDDEIIEAFFNEKREFIFRLYDGKEKLKYFSREEEKFQKKKSVSKNYKYYFFKYIQSKLNAEKRTEIEKELLEIDEHIFDDFDQKCQIGENDHYICELIRMDSIVEFVAFTNKSLIGLSSQIKESIFETHPFLLQREATLIEYAAFFGSIQIFNYL